jgi:hypothetical protein
MAVDHRLDVCADFVNFAMDEPFQGRTLSPVVQMFIDHAREVVKPLAKL